LSIFPFEIFADLPREGPGDNEFTRKAYFMLKDIPQNPDILDIGCGPGMQTIELAKLSGGKILAIDNHQPYLDKLKRRAREEGLSDLIEISNQDMFTMDMGRKFDVVWSEGAIYIIGLEDGLKQWRGYLHKGGYIVVSHLSWLKANPPDEVIKFWKTEFPQMRTMEKDLESIRNLDYEIAGHFILPESAWWKNYYSPLENNIRNLRKKYIGSREKLMELDQTYLEIDLYRKYSEYYGYIFYIMRKLK